MDALHSPNEHPEATIGAVGSIVDALMNPEELKRLELENRMVQARLGVASGLYVALRAKHPLTASHCLRVAITLSSWAMTRNMNESATMSLEVAGLLHDIGKIGVADRVLMKRSRLSGDEKLQLNRHWKTGLNIISRFCNKPEILDNFRYSPAWFDGSKRGFRRSGADLPLGARMLAIADAYDSMVSDMAYRTPRSQQDALLEIKEGSGTQFDPGLVKEFIYLLTEQGPKLEAAVARRWLRELADDDADQVWCAAPPQHNEAASHLNNQLFTRLLSSMHDGVIFVDPESKIVVWNRATERLTGIIGSAVLQTKWAPSLIDLRNRDGRPPESCPLSHAMLSGVQSLERMTIQSKSGQRLSVDTHVVPLTNPDGSTAGAALLLHDASHQSDLEERVQTLHEKATRDPLTKVSNRAEFDRMLPSFLDTHGEMGLVCSLVICDIDHFKRINDTHGHQAGDDALIEFAAVLRSHSREGDLVARYGGEEFVMLMADCNVEQSARRADELRREIAAQPRSMLEGACMSASFGVTESQPGDTPENMLRRADRALLQAKENGRNRVIQMCSGGMRDVHIKTDALSRFLGRDATRGNLESRMISAVPLEVAVAKLRGFISDRKAHLVRIEETEVTLHLEVAPGGAAKRSDRPTTFIVELRLSELKPDSRENPKVAQRGTLIDVSLQPKRRRDRRLQDIERRSVWLMGDIKAYFMASDM